MEVLFLNIAIDRSLASMAKELEKRGYHVFFIGENQMADAILYNENTENSFYGVNTLISEGYSLTSGHEGYGAILINAANRTVEDIARILESRLYSPLF